MAKRGPTSDLHHDNWDKEEEPEEAGVFTTATTEQMKNRIVKKGKRRCENLDESDGNGKVGETKSVFSGFSFGPKASTSSRPDSWPMFGANSTNTTTSTTNGSANHAPVIPPPKPDPTQSARQPETKNSTNDFLHRLKLLNESVVHWITKHVEENPHCVLTPIFQDYGKYFGDLERKYPNTISFGQPPVNTQTSDSSPSTSKNSQNEEAKSDAVDSDKAQNSLAKSLLKPVVTVASAISNTLAPLSPNVTVKKPESESAKGDITTPINLDMPFSVNVPTTGMFPNSRIGTPFSFACAAKEDSNQDDDEDDEPPKVEVQQVIEENAFFSQRCKLFYKKGAEYVERGVGLLHLKPAGAKTQLVVRADTNLGNILLNIILSSNIPFQRTGKNNVSLCCIPNPPIVVKAAANADSAEKEEAVPMLIRVKTAEQADELLEQIMKHKS